ncbi:hypothetical protein B296_00046887 [Ensete ventricosum]|uniref:Uncharacterized protein n=1 Tax=Ensete ventricosum TaxID=4639 RepID=A0A426XHA5_ENSVE|nr:hypothetical protein B296_00046887 [Ensete ventricosum]
MLMMRSGAFGPTSSGCALTNPTICTQWSPDLSSSSWASSSPLPPTSSSPKPQPLRL